MNLGARGISPWVNVLLVYVIGGSVVLFGKNRVLKLAVVNKIVRA